MTAYVQQIRRLPPMLGPRDAAPGWRGTRRRGVAVVMLLAGAALVPGGWTPALQALSDAYLAVSVFVAGTLALLLAAERLFETDLGGLLQRYRRWQVPAAALLGAFPGCGGAIVAVTHYTRGHLSFGAVVAALTATMGDAMFLLLARAPQTALGVLAAGVTAGVITGWFIDRSHGPDFMRQRPAAAARPARTTYNAPAASVRPLERLWLGLAVPGLVIGLLSAFQIDVDGWLFGDGAAVMPALWLGVAGATLALLMWVSQGDGDPAACSSRDAACPTVGRTAVRAVIHTTNAVTAWVACAFVGYQLIMAGSGIDLAGALAVWGPLVPAMAVLIGFVPGCGPQIMVTSLYLSGTAPLSAQLANAVANDGDALLPAIAVAPKAALVASLYSAVPALIVGYGWYAAVEAGM